MILSGFTKIISPKTGKGFFSFSGAGTLCSDGKTLTIAAQAGSIYFAGSAMLVPTAQAAVENRAKDAVTERIIFFFIFIYFKFNRKSS